MSDDAHRKILMPKEEDSEETATSSHDDRLEQRLTNRDSDETTPTRRGRILDAPSKHSKKLSPPATPTKRPRQDTIDTDHDKST